MIVLPPPLGQYFLSLLFLLLFFHPPPLSTSALSVTVPEDSPLPSRTFALWKKTLNLWWSHCHFLLPRLSSKANVFSNSLGSDLTRTFTYVPYHFDNNVWSNKCQTTVRYIPSPSPLVSSVGLIPRIWSNKQAWPYTQTRGLLDNCWSLTRPSPFYRVCGSGSGFV